MVFRLIGIMETVLPNQFLPAMRLLRALQKNGNERDERLIHVALGHLDAIHREHILSRAVGENELWALELAHRGDRAYQALSRNSMAALRVVFWKLGLITDPGVGHKWRARRCPLTMRLMEKHLGADPAWIEFACLACGNIVYLKAGQKGEFTCSICGHGSRLSYNDGCRIAFSRPRAARPSWVSVERNPDLDPYEVLQVPPTAAFDEMRKAYRRQLLSYHPDKVYSLGSPTASWAAEEATRNLNAAWCLVEQRAK